MDPFGRKQSMDHPQALSISKLDLMVAMKAVSVLSGNLRWRSPARHVISRLS
jgi:hypothetical protein